MLREDRPRTIKTQTDVSGRRGGDVAVGPHQIYQTTTGRQREQAVARTFPRGIKAGGMCASARFQSPVSKATLYSQFPENVEEEKIQRKKYADHAGLQQQEHGV